MKGRITNSNSDAIIAHQRKWQRPKLSINVTRKMVNFYRETVELMHIAKGDRIDFMQIGGVLFIKKHPYGHYKLQMTGVSSITLPCHSFINFLEVNYNMKGFKVFTVLKSTTEHDGYRLFQIELHKKYLDNFDKNAVKDEN